MSYDNDNLKTQIGRSNIVDKFWFAKLKSPSLISEFLKNYKNIKKNFSQLNVFQLRLIIDMYLSICTPGNKNTPTS